MAFSARDISKFIPEYDGDQSTLHDFISACDHVINYVENENLIHIPFLIKSRLKGAAKQFISSRALANWQDIRNLLLSHFGDTRDAESLLRELTNSFQKNSENPRSYVQRVQLILTKLRNCTALDDELDRNSKIAMNIKHEKIGLKAILSGLSDPIGQILRSQRPQTIEDATSILSEEENLQYLKSFRNLNIRDNFQKPSQIIPKTFKPEIKSNAKHCSYCQRTGHTINECYKKQNRTSYQTPSTSTPIKGNFIPQNTNYSRQVPNMTQPRPFYPQQNRQSVIQRTHHLNMNGEENQVEVLQCQTDREISIEQDENTQSH